MRLLVRDRAGRGAVELGVVKRVFGGWYEKEKWVWAMVAGDGDCVWGRVEGEIVASWWHELGLGARCERIRGSSWTGNVLAAKRLVL